MRQELIEYHYLPAPLRPKLAVVALRHLVWILEGLGVLDPKACKFLQQFKEIVGRWEGSK